MNGIRAETIRPATSAETRDWRAKFTCRFFSRYHAEMLATTKQPVMSAAAMVCT